jgi:hypothetical protein
MLRIVARRALLASLALGCATLGDGGGSFAIHVVDAAGRGVPCVRLTTPQQIVLVTDRDGVAEFWEPGLMGREVFFTPTREGWQHAADPTGLRGGARVAPAAAPLRLEQVGPACDAGAGAPLASPGATALPHRRSTRRRARRSLISCAAGGALPTARACRLRRPRALGPRLRRGPGRLLTLDPSGAAGSSPPGTR